MFMMRKSRDSPEITNISNPVPAKPDKSYNGGHSKGDSNIRYYS